MSAEKMLEAAVRVAMRRLGVGRQFQRPSPNLAERLEDRVLLSGGPTVQSIVRTTPSTSITDAASVTYTVTFTSSVSGVDATDFRVSTTGSAGAGASLGVSGGGQTYSVNVAGIHGGGDLRLDLIDDDSITDFSSTPLGGAGADNGSFQGQTYSILPVNPQVLSILRASPPGSLAGPGGVSFAVNFTEPVTGVDASDFQAVSSVSASAPVVSGSGSDYTVTFNNVSGSGSLGLNLIDDGSIRDAAGNPLVGNDPTPSFQPQLTLGAGTSPRGVAVADVNGDGAADVVIANAGSNSVSVILGNGSGLFQNQLTFAVGLDPYNVAVADVNGDGRPDILVPNRSSNSVSVLINAGSGNFLPQATLAAGANPTSVATVDVNNDGKPDLAVSNSGSGNVGVFVNNGNGTFAPQATFATGTTPQSVTAADSNADGNQDLIAANLNSGSLSLLLGNGNGTFQSQMALFTDANPTFVAAADPNADGQPDLLMTTRNSTNVGVLANEGGQFEQEATFGIGSPSNSAAAADVNGDGKFDLIDADSSSSEVSVLTGNGVGNFLQAAATFATGFHPYSVAIADFNGDGRPDVVTANASAGNASVLLNADTGSLAGPFYTITQAQLVQSIKRTTPAGPGASTSSVTYTLKLNQSVTGVDATDFKVFTDGGVTTTSPISVSGSGATYTVTVGGIHGSGDLRLDLVDNDSIVGSGNSLPLGGSGAGNGSVEGEVYTIVQTYPKVLSINRSNPAGSTTSASTVSFAVTFSTAVTGVDASDFQVALSGVTAAAPVVSGSGAAYTVTIGSIAGAGTLGLNLVDNGSIHDAAGNRLGGNGVSFQSQATFAVGALPIALSVADVDGDGKLDAVVANKGGSVSELKGNGDGTFQAQTTSAAGQYPNSVASADVNGDGKPDLVVANELPGGVTVLRGNGNGTFQAPAFFAAGDFPTFATAADVNGDGAPDILVSNYNSSNASVLLNNGDGTFAAQTTFAAIANPLALATADVNGDGKPDVLVANYNGDSIGVLLGAGAGNFQPETTFATAPAPNALTTADVNADGKIDLLVASEFAKNVSVLLGNGDGTFRTPFTYSTGQAPSSIAAADVNADGKIDIVTANPNGGNISVLLGNGTGSFQNPVTISAGSEPISVVPADINRDGRPDLVVADYSLHNVRVLLNVAKDDFTGQVYTITKPSSAHFDFGTPTSPVAAGYTGVSEATTYTAAKGYGWQTAPAGSRDRATSDPLARDFVYAGSGGATFAVDLANGTYAVTIKVGDPTTKRDNQGIYFEGALAGNITTAAGQVYTNTYKVTVSDGQLNVLLKDLGGSDGFATIDSLDITPPSHFDFGTATSPVAAGYFGVSEATSYTAAQGYGWQTAPLGSRDRGAVSGTTALTQDFDYTGSTGSTFAVNLPNGIYKVTVTTGDATTKRDNQAIILEGTQVDSITNAAGQFLAHTYAVAVTDGQLNVQLKDLGGSDPYAVIDALDIVAYSAHYDFGTTTSPVASGYARVSEATIFSAAQGYGWLAAPAGSRDRGAVSGTTALTQDFDYTSSAGSTFAVNLPNGTYNVTVTMGDATTKRDNQGLYLEGTQVGTITTNAGQYLAKTYAVTVADGQLTLLLKDLGGSDAYAVIDGLDIAVA